MRHEFVPAPESTERRFRRATPLELPLLTRWSAELRRDERRDHRHREAWQWEQVPDHLKNHLGEVDDKNKKKLAEGRSLQDLKEALKGKVQETLSAVADDGTSRAGCVSGVSVSCRRLRAKRGNYKVKAYALVDERDSVAIKLFDNPLEQQRKAMWQGCAVCC